MRRLSGKAPPFDKRQKHNNKSISLCQLVTDAIYSCGEFNTPTLASGYVDFSLTEQDIAGIYPD